MQQAGVRAGGQILSSLPHEGQRTEGQKVKNNLGK